MYTSPIEEAVNEAVKGLDWIDVESEVTADMISELMYDLIDGDMCPSIWEGEEEEALEACRLLITYFGTKGKHWDDPED